MLFLKRRLWKKCYNHSNVYLQTFYTLKRCAGTLAFQPYLLALNLHIEYPYK